MILLFGNIYCQQSRIPGESYLEIIGGTNRNISLAPVTSVYGDINDGYPLLNSSNYNYSAYTNYFCFDFASMLEGCNRGIYYGKYKLTVDNNYYIFLDFNDHHYGDHVGLYGTNYVNPDIVVRFDPSDHSFENEPHGGDSYSIPNGYVVKIWADDRKTGPNGGTGPFGSPAIPSNFNSQIVSTGPGTYSPKLTWNLNEERDIDGYQLWRRLDGGSWLVKANLDHPTTSYTDYSVVITGKNTKYANYKLKARDWGNLFSGFTHVEMVRYNYVLYKVDESDKSNKTTLANVIEPMQFELFQNSPNPFNPSTTISFALPEPCNVNLTVYDIMGNKIDQIFLDDLASGRHQLRWNGEKYNGESVASGIYIYKLEAIALKSGKVYSANKKMQYMR